MSAATTIDLIVNQRASFEVGFFVKQSNGAILDLTNYSVAAKYKQQYQVPDNQAIAFTATVANAANGEVTIALSPEQTAAMELGKYVYDVAITDLDGFKTRIVEGNIKVSGGVS